MLRLELLNSFRSLHSHAYVLNNNIRNRNSSVLLEADPSSVWRAEGRVFGLLAMVMQNDILLWGDDSSKRNENNENWSAEEMPIPWCENQ